ncbi:MAG TPA: MFS transporter [Gaiellaceae bacterium]|nr:MFS transporter [Gaiellaceae bacterium]
MIVLVTDAVPPLGLARYRALFRVPHVTRLVLSGQLARLPMGMIGLALLLLVREQGGSYAAAGAVSGAYFVATAVGAPIAGRLVDRRGQTRILLRRAVIFPALLGAVCVLALLDAPIALIGACAAAAGALMPPVGASLRALWPRLFTQDDLRAAAYALEASLQEITFVVGPLLVALLTAAASPVLALGVAAAAGGLGTTLIALAQPVQGWRPEEDRTAASVLGALESRGVVSIVALSACLGLGFGATEVGFPAFAEGHGGAELGSVPLSLFAGGSLVGGLLAGALVTATPLRLLRVSGVLLTFGLALPLLGWSLPSMGVLAFLAGLPIAPVVMSAYGLIDAVAARGTAAEAFAWITTAVFAGFSVGMALGGMLIDAYSVRGSFLLAAAAAAVGALVVSVGAGLEEP